MTLRVVVPESESGSVDLDDRERLLALYAPPRPDWLRLNLVTTVSGSAAGPDGTSESITSRTDRRLLGVIRELADVVLVGAQSVRAEGYQLPRRAPLAVVTRSGELGGHRIEGADGRSALVLGPESARARAAASIDAPFTALADESMPTLLAALRAQGYGSIVCEGGPNLAGQLVTAGLVDEVCLTTSPRLGGRDLSLLGGAPVDAALELRQLLVDDDGTLFARWSVS